MFLYNRSPLLPYYGWGGGVLELRLVFYDCFCVIQISLAIFPKTIF